MNKIEKILHNIIVFPLMVVFFNVLLVISTFVPGTMWKVLEQLNTKIREREETRLTVIQFITGMSVWILTILAITRV